MKRLEMALIVVAIGASCAVGLRQEDACVASCTNAEPEHPSECADACIANDGDTALATAEVKKACELTEDPPPVPTTTEKWLCEGVQEFGPGCVDRYGQPLFEFVSPKSQAPGYSDTQAAACATAKDRATALASRVATINCIYQARICRGCTKAP